MIEIWKDIYFIENGIIYDYRGLYQVSNLGRVKSFPRKYTDKKERILKFGRTKRGYLIVNLCKDNKRKLFRVHRLVAYMFIPNLNNLPEVNHKNEIKDCNEVWNLEWCTCIYNRRYSQNKKVNQYGLDGNFIKSWDSIMEIEKKLNIKSQCICYCCKGKYKTAGGYIWKYRLGDK